MATSVATTSHYGKGFPTMQRTPFTLWQTAASPGLCSALKTPWVFALGSCKLRFGISYMTRKQVLSPFMEVCPPLFGSWKNMMVDLSIQPPRSSSGSTKGLLPIIVGVGFGCIRHDAVPLIILFFSLVGIGLLKVCRKPIQKSS